MFTLRRSASVTPHVPAILSVLVVLTLVGVGIGAQVRSDPLARSATQVALAPMGASSHGFGPWNRGSWPSWGQAPAKPVVRVVPRPKPRTPARPPRASVAHTHAPRPVALSRAFWECLMMRESGGRPLPCNPYCGRLQWLPRTWRVAGGTQYAALPQYATKDQEIAVADAFIRGGANLRGQWPPSRFCL